MRRPDLMGIRHRIVQSTIGRWSVEPGQNGWEIHIDGRRLVEVTKYADALVMAKARQDLTDLLDYVRHLEGARAPAGVIKKTPRTMFG